MTGSAVEWDFPDPFTIDVTVEPGDIDGLGHTNNTVYVRWMEGVAWAHSAAVGLPLEECRRLDRVMAVREHHVRYLAPSFAGDRIRVANWIAANDGRLSAKRRFQICRIADGTTLVRAVTAFVCIDFSKGRPRRMPPVFVERYPVTITDAAEI